MEAKGCSPGGRLFSFIQCAPSQPSTICAHETKGVFKPTEASFTLEDNGVGVDWPDLAWEPNASDLLDLRAGMEARPAIAEFGFHDPSNIAEYSFDKVRKTLKLEKE